jgi:hypothetical protein
MNGVPTSARLALITVGFTLWASAFVAIYGLNAVGCQFGWHSGVQRAALVLVLAAHLGLLGWIAVRQWRRFREAHQAPASVSFINYVGRSTLTAAWFATLLNLAPVFFLEMCAS